MKILPWIILVTTFQSISSFSINANQVELESTSESNIEEIKRQEYQRALAQGKALNGMSLSNSLISTLLVTIVYFRKIHPNLLRRKGPKTCHALSLSIPH